MNYQDFINNFVARMETCKVKFVRGTEELEEGVIKLDFSSKKSVANIEQLITNQLVVMGIEYQYLPFSDNCFTWLLSDKNTGGVWHIVIYKEECKMIIQWKVEVNQ